MQPTTTAATRPASRPALSSQTKAPRPAPKPAVTFAQLDPKTQAVVHTAIARGTAAAGWNGTSLLILSAQIDPGTEAGQAVARARAEQEKRAIAALRTWTRYAAIEVTERAVTLQTPDQLQPYGSWEGLLYTCDTYTGECSCPDQHNHLERINRDLLTHCPTAAPVICKHWIMAAIMGARGEITLPTAPQPDPAQIQTPAALAAPAEQIQPEPTKEITYATWGDLPGYDRLEARMQRDYRYSSISLDLLAKWEKDHFVSRSDAAQLRQLAAAAGIK